MSSQTTRGKRTLILGTAGHIDHGKTTLVRALTGTDTDRLPEEKKRGMTIDIGFAELELGDFRLGLIDVPGHERFVKNMLAGTTTVDVALLVVAADDGVMPQTREHLAILDLLDIPTGVVAITKCDTRPADWLELVEDDVKSLIAGTCLRNAPIVFTAAGNDSRQGLEELQAALLTACETVKEQGPGELFRLPVDRSFTIPGRGTVLTGSVWSGTAEVGQEFELLPMGKRITIRGLENHGIPVNRVQCGERGAINVSGVHHLEVRRGFELATPGYLKPSRLLTVELCVLPESPRGVKDRTRQRLHIGAQEVIVEVSLLDQKMLEPGDRGLAQLTPQEGTVSVCGQPFVLRAESPLTTLGGGHVLQPMAKRFPRGKFNQHDRLKLLLSDNAQDRIDAALYFFGADCWETLDLCRNSNVFPAEVEQILNELRDTGHLVELRISGQKKRIFHAQKLEEYQQRILNAVDSAQAAAPLEPAIQRKRLCSRFADLGGELTDAVIARLISSNLLQGNEQWISSRGYAPQLSNQQSLLLDNLVLAYEKAGLEPPAASELADWSAAGETDSLLRLAASQGSLVHLGGELYLAAGAESAMKQAVAKAMPENGMTVSQIKELLGTSRKYAVPFCEYLDKIEFTRRIGDVRMLNAQPAGIKNHG